MHTQTETLDWIYQLYTHWDRDSPALALGEMTRESVLAVGQQLFILASHLKYFSTEVC